MTEHPPEARKPRSKRVYVYWGVALTTREVGFVKREAWGQLK